ncbi:hypothetical protein [Nocardia sp. NBC_00416]
MSTIAGIHKESRSTRLPGTHSARPGAARSLLIVWVFLMAVASLALVLL